MHTIYFDFGNVIGFFDHWKSINRLVRYTKLSGPELFDVLLCNQLEDDYERGALTSAEYIREGIDRAKMTCTPTEFHDAFRDIFTPNPEVCEAIPKLAQHYRILLASNTNDMHFSHYCEQFQDVLSHFAALPTSHQAKARKPETGFFDYAQSFAKAKPGECVFVDDLAINIAAGQQYGWNGLHYTPGCLKEKLKSFGIAL
ncbi:hypothetical protein BH11PLA2_BH11PLA2_23900 [soil metagenome]